MLAELATFALILAFTLCVLQGGYAFGTRLNPLLLRLSAITPTVVFFLIVFAFATLILLRVDSDFSIANVAEHSNIDLPLLYKIAGTWGNHEGSMLLWVLVMAGCSILLSYGNSAHTSLIIKAQAVQALLTAGVLFFIIATSNPFARIFPPPRDGAMLNPLLQDIALAMHPPMLYGGYVGFSMVFSLAVAGLWQKNIGRNWAEITHPWIMGAWSLLTLGIGLGSWWAYRELGWGGYWFWDPVENASLLPWLAGTALLHSNIVLKKRGMLSGWVILLAIITFGLSMLGTFLVRSGLLTSVHSFASDPERGLYILIYMGVALGAALALYAARIGTLATPAKLRPSSREGMIVINNLFLLTACATVLVGTLYPMIIAAFTSRSVSVGAPYFNLTFLPLMALPLIFTGLTPYLPWKKAAFATALRKILPAIFIALTVGILVLSQVKPYALLSAVGLALSVYLLVASGQWMGAGKWKNIRQWPVFIAHSGVALLVLGITGVGLWTKESERFVAIGDTINIAGYTLLYNNEEPIETGNYTAKRATIIVRKNGALITTLTPEYRHYGARDTNTSEVSLHTTPAYDLYTVIGEPSADGKKTALRVYFKPTISFIWGGGLAMTLGGLLACMLSLRPRKERL